MKTIIVRKYYYFELASFCTGRQNIFQKFQVVHGRLHSYIYAHCKNLIRSCVNVRKKKLFQLKTDFFRFCILVTKIRLFIDETKGLFISFFVHSLQCTLILITKVNILFMYLVLAGPYKSAPIAATQLLRLRRVN